MTLDDFKNLLYKERQAIDAVSTTVKQNMASFLAIVASLAIPAVPAIFAANGVYTLTSNWSDHWRLSVTLATACAVEGAGLYLSLLATKTYSAWRKGAASIKEIKAMASAVVIYTLIAIALILFSDVSLALKLVIIFIPILGIAFYVGIGFETDLANRLDEIADEKKRKIAEKQAQKVAQLEAKKSRIEAPKVGKITPISQVEKSQWRPLAREIFADNPQISGAELGRRIGASERTGQMILAELRNGHE